MGCQFSAGAITSLFDSMHDLSGVRVANSEHLDNNTTTTIVPCPNLNLGMGLVMFASSSVSAEPVDLIRRARSHSSSACTNYTTTECVLDMKCAATRC